MKISTALCAIAALGLAVLSFATPASSLSNNQSDAAAATVAEKHLVGAWESRWEEVLRPKFTSEVDSSPLRLQLRVEGGKPTGAATRDSISLDDGPVPGVKKLVVMGKETVPLFDLRFDGKRLLFKERRGGSLIESRLELVGENKAKLSTKRGKGFQSWLTLMRIEPR